MQSTNTTFCLKHSLSTERKSTISVLQIIVKKKPTQIINSQLQKPVDLTYLSISQSRNQPASTTQTKQKKNRNSFLFTIHTATSSHQHKEVEVLKQNWRTNAIRISNSHFDTSKGPQQVAGTRRVDSGVDAGSHNRTGRYSQRNCSSAWTWSGSFSNRSRRMRTRRRFDAAENTAAPLLL